MANYPDDKILNMIEFEADQWQEMRRLQRLAFDGGEYNLIPEAMKERERASELFASHLDLPFMDVEIISERTGDHELTVTIKIVNRYDDWSSPDTE